MENTFARHCIKYHSRTNLPVGGKYARMNILTFVISNLFRNLSFDIFLPVS